MAGSGDQSATAVVFDKRLESHFSAWNKNFTETPQRVEGILSRCEELQLLDRCTRIPAREATEAEILTCHTKAHLDLLESTANMSEAELQSISQKYDYIYFHKKSSDNAKLALGGVIDLIDAIASEKVKNGIAIVRPPGHHAMLEEYCGYCYLGNVSIAAHLMLEKYQMKRILVLDWDVHHGQGTQFAFYNDPRVLYISIHRYEHGREWPSLREGDYDFTGEGPGKGYNINVPLNELGCDNSDYLAIMFNLLLPIFYQFDPELVLVSAGYDCAIGCPEGEMSVTPACFAHFVNLLKPLAKGKLALILEGGYNLKSLAESAALSLRALLGDPTPAILPTVKPKNTVIESILNCIKVLHQHWSCLQYQDFVEAQHIKAETYPYMGVLHLPPVKDVVFYTSHNRPEMFPLIQDCASADVLEKQAHFNKIIADLIASTSLAVPQHRLSVVCESEESGLLKHLKTSELWSSCYSLQEDPTCQSATDCVTSALKSIMSRQAQSSLCVFTSQKRITEQAVNGKPLNCSTHGEPDLVHTLVQCAIDTHSVNRILFLDLSGELAHIEDSPSLLYIAVRATEQETSPVLSQHNLDIQVLQSSVNDADYISLFLQVILPLAYQFCPDLVVVKLGSSACVQQPYKAMSIECMGHVIQLLSGLATGRLLLLAEDNSSALRESRDNSSALKESRDNSSTLRESMKNSSPRETTDKRVPPPPLDTSTSIGDTSGDEMKSKPIPEGVGSATCGEEMAEGEKRLSELTLVVEECVKIMLGGNCRQLKNGLPSSSTVQTIISAQDKLKDHWSMFSFREQVPLVSS